MIRSILIWFTLLSTLFVHDGPAQTIVRQRISFNLNGVQTEGKIHRNYNTYPATAAGDAAVRAAVESGVVSVTLTSGFRNGQVITARVTSPPASNTTSQSTAPPWVPQTRYSYSTTNNKLVVESSAIGTNETPYLSFGRVDGQPMTGLSGGGANLTSGTYYHPGPLSGQGSYVWEWTFQGGTGATGVPPSVPIRVTYRRGTGAETYARDFTPSVGTGINLLTSGNTSPPGSTTMTPPPSTTTTLVSTAGYGNVYAANSTYVPLAETPRVGSNERSGQYNRVYMDNGSIRVGFNLKLGGCIDYMAFSGGENQINSPLHHAGQPNETIDAGRQHLLSWYAQPGGGVGPFGDGHYTEAGQTTGRFGGTGPWRDGVDGTLRGSIGWNIVGAGDEGESPTYAALHAFSVSNNGSYIKNSGKQWNMHNVVGQQDTEFWVRFDPNNARAYREHVRLTMRRTDAFIDRFPDVRVQEAPCDMHIVDYRKAYFTSGQPYTNDWREVEIRRVGAPSNVLSNEPFIIIGTADGTRFHALYAPVAGRFGLDLDIPDNYGATSKDYQFPVTYLASNPRMCLDPTGIYDLDVAGGYFTSLTDAKAWCYAQPRWSGTFNYKFNQRSRHAWTYHHAKDQLETNVTDGLRVRAQMAFNENFGRDMKLEAPEVWVNGRVVKKVYIRAAFSGPASALRFHWYRSNGQIEAFGAPNRTEYTMPMTGIQFDGVVRTYEVNLEGHSEWNNQDIIGWGFGFDYPYPNDVSGVLWDIKEISSSPIN